MTQKTSKGEKREMKKIRYISISLALITTLVLGIIIGRAQVFGSTIYIMGGIYPGAPTYTIWRDGSVYYAKDANGQVDFSGTNASYVINSAIGTGERTVYLKIAEYVLTAPILINYNFTWLIGENREKTILSTIANIDLIKVYPASGFLENFKLAHVWLKGMGIGSTSMGLNVTGQVYYSQFDNIVTTANYDGLHFQATYATRGYRHILTTIHAKENLNSGLYFMQQDAISIYKVDSHANVYGVIIEDLCQGFVIQSARIDQNTGTGIYIVGSQVIRMDACMISDSGTYGLFINGGSTDVVFENSYIESSTEEQIIIGNTAAFSNYDIKVVNSRIVRGEKNGITIVGDNNKNNTNIRIEGNTIINNGQLANNTYWGIEAYGTGAEATTYVYINSNYIGNDPEETGLIRQRGVQSLNDSNYFMVTGNDVSTSLYTAAITEQITLVGANNFQAGNFGDV